MAQFANRVTFAVPAGAGAYAPERLNLARSSTSVGAVSLLGVTAVIEAAVATAVLELWLLRVGGDPTNDADFFNTAKSITASGGETWALAGWGAVQLRAKSGGTAGSLTVSATAD